MPTSFPATPSPSPTPSPLLLAWQRVSNPGLASVADITASAAAGDRFVVIGQDQNAGGAIWTSGDGRSWSQVDPSTLPGSLTLADVTANGNGFIAVGETYSNSSGILLTSADGRSWQPMDSATLAGWSYQRVAVIGSTIVIATESADFTKQGVVVSSDGGSTWSSPDQPSGLPNAYLLALTATDTDFWAFAPASGGNKPPIGIWRSTDGMTWTSVGSLTGSDGAGGLAVAHGPLGWAAIASTTQHQKEVDVAWWSADGVSWQAAQPAPFGVTNIFADDAGFIAVGNYFPNGSGCAIDPKQAVGLTFTSTDGLLWRRLSEDGWMSQYIEQLRRYNRTLIGIGLDFSQSDLGTGAVWTAKLPPIANDTGPEPTNPPMPQNGCGP